MYWHSSALYCDFTGVDSLEWVIPCQINTKKYLTSWIWTKLGSYIVPVETFTHSQFQCYMLYGFRVRASQKVNFSPNFGLPLGT